MNNENQIPEMPKVNENNINVQQTNNNVINNQDPVVLQTLPQEEKRESQTKIMAGEVKETTSKEVKNMQKFLKDIKNYITSKNSSELLSLLWRLALIAGFVILLYVPFQLLMDLGSNLFVLFGIDYTTKLGNIWNSIWYISYGILAIVLFFILCKDRYYKLVKQQEDEKKIMKDSIK